MGSSSTMAAMSGCAPRPSRSSRSPPRARSNYCASLGISETVICRCRCWRTGCASVPITSSHRWSRRWAAVSPGARRRSIRRSAPMPGPPTRLNPSTEPRPSSNDQRAGLYRLLAWSSPSFPVCAFSYSHGLEAATVAGAVYDRATLQGWIIAIIAQGSGRIDAEILREAYRAVNADDLVALDAANRRGCAFRASAELALEAGQQGEAFLTTCLGAWPEPVLQNWARSGSSAGYSACYSAAFGAAA